MDKIPFCDIDAIILAQLSYTRLGTIVAEEFNGKQITIEKAADFVLWDKTRLKDDDDEELWQLLKTSPRFKDLVLVGHLDRFDIEAEKQFSAVTVLMPGRKAAVVYRGTDFTIVGWKEDFNMSFTDHVPAQLEALAYLEDAAKNLPAWDLLVCGHSKGGNLAVYAGAFCSEEIQDRIQSIRNFDGPGFSEEIAAQEGMKRILEKTRTYLPQSSVVGMLLEHEEEFTIVHSRKMGLMQHDLYNWSVIGKEFVIEQETTDSSQFIDKALKDWLKAMSKQQREAFVETVFSILDDCDAVTLKELFSRKNLLTVMKNLTAMEPEERELIQEGMAILSGSVRKTLPIGQKDEGNKNEDK